MCYTYYCTHEQYTNHRHEVKSAMDNTNGQPYTWCDPEPEEEHDGAIPRRVYSGWVKITRWDRSQTVVKVETVRFLGTLTGDILYPPRPKGYPLYDNLFLQGVRKECIPEAEALAWLRQHGLPLPDDQDADARPAAVDEEPERSG
jgi:hypothetical protein